MGFDAASQVEPLDWDFTKFGGGKGTIPEPSMSELRAFRQKLLDLLPSGDSDEADEADVARLYSLSPEERDRLNDASVDVVAEFCKGSPSLDEILALPGRIRSAFVDWIIAETRPSL